MRTIRQENMTKNAGFTLIELAIVMVIIGMIVASSATAYVQWQKFERFETTKDNVESARNAIEGFLAQNGRYPCPAPLDADRTDTTTYGTEPNNPNDCASPAALGTMPFADVFVAAKQGAAINYIDPATGAIIAGNPNIRIGTIPFRNLGLDEEQAYDGYRNRLFYAVTEHLASQNSFDPDTGGISIEDNAGQSLVTPPDSGHFIVFSAGENGLGAYTREGVQIACPGAATIENENCNMDALFIADNYSTSNDLNNQDDIVAYGAVLPPSWTRPQGGNLNIAQAAQERVGLGVATADDPQEELDVTGTINLQDDPTTTEIEGKLKAQVLCDYNDPTDPDCFDISAITGLVIDGEGMECPDPDEYIIAIENNAPVCGVVTVGCPNAGEVILGVRANGDFDCGTAPLPCPSQNENICSGSDLLVAAPDGTTDTVSVTTPTGGTRSRDFECRNGSWEPQGNEYGDPCNCVPRTLNVDTNVSCADTRYNCGDRFSGTYDVRTERVCPSGNTNSIRFNDNCVCIETTQTNSGSCSQQWRVNRMPSSDRPPSGYSFNTGNIDLIRRHQCPSATCTGWEYVSSNCGCSNGSPTTQRRACSNGFPADEIVTRQFVCSGGQGPGQYGREEIVSVDDSACTCSGSQPGTPRDCSTLSPSMQNLPGSNGVETTDTFSLVGANCVRTTTDNGPVTDYCENPPPRVCSWSAETGTSIGMGAVSEDAGGQCDCDAFAGTALPCNSGPGQHFRRCNCN